MQYHELKNRFELPSFWTYDKKESRKGIGFQDAWIKNVKFKEFKEELKEGITKTVFPPIDAAKNEEEVGANLDPVFERLSKSYITSDAVNQELLLKKANKNTLQKKLQEWCKQLNINAPLVKEHLGVKIFKNKLKKVPAIIICAGPSLEFAVEHLKTLKDKACIIATDTAFRSCTKRGIDPHFVNAHDANPNGAKFFKDIKTDSIGVFVNYVSPLTIEAYKGKKIFYYVEDDSISTYKTMALACDDKKRADGSFLDSKIIGGSSVAHTALYYALHMGCDPITFVGLDLSYPDLEKSHFESDNMKNVKNQKLVDCEDLQGRLVKTNLSFYSYKTVFDKMAPVMVQIYGAKLFTSTEGKDGKVTGIVHAGLEPVGFKEFIDKYCEKDRPELKNLMEVYNSYGRQ